MSTAQKSGKKTLQVLITLAVLVYAANAVSVKWGGSPFLYCWGRETAWAAVEPFISMVGIALLVWMAVRIAKGDTSGAIGAAVLAVLAFGAPQFGATIFGLGGSCG